MKHFTTISMTFMVLHIYSLEKKSAECFLCDDDEDGDDYDEVCTCN